MKKIITLLLLFLVHATHAYAQDTPKVLFSPKGGCEQAIVDEIAKAQKTINVAMYELTSREISQALIAAKARGVIIRIFLDLKEGKTKYSKGTYLSQNGIAVKYYMGHGLMHNKFAVIDEKILLTGSFNWTPTAEQKNQENLLVLDDPVFIKQYSDRFEYLWKTQ